MDKNKEQIINPGLYLVSTPIGNMEDITLRALNVLKKSDIILCEDTRRSGKLLSYFKIEGQLLSYHKFNEKKISNKIIEAIERGMKYTSVEYNDARSKIEVANAYFNQFFHDYDAILTPSANGEAPKGLESTGDPIFSTIWTFCGMPSISLPLLQGKNGLPVGIQLVSSLYDDERLFRNASWLTSKIKK